MPVPLTAPVAMLVSVLIGGGLVLRADGRQRRLDRQLTVATAGFGLPAVPPRHQESIQRVVAPDGQRRRLLHRIVGYYPDSTLAWPAASTIIAGLLAGAAGFLITDLLLGPLPALAVGVILAVLMIRFLFGWQRDRYADKLLRQLPDSIQVMVGAVRVGMPIAEAIRILARESREPSLSEFARVADELALGLSADQALLNIFRRTGVREFAIFAVTLAVQTRSGGQLAETINTVGDTVRERIAIAGRARALAGEAKLSAQVVGALPFVMVCVLSLINPAYLGPLVHDRRGHLMLAYAIASWMFGILAMRLLIKRGTTV